MKNSNPKKRKLQGVVVSDKMEKTIVVRVDRLVEHPLYKKRIKRSNRFKAHDEKGEAKMGDFVEIVESNPISKDKKWRLSSIVRKGIEVE